MLRRATIGCVMLVTLMASDVFAQSETLRAVGRLRRPAVRSIPARFDIGTGTVRPTPVREITPPRRERQPGDPVICRMGVRDHPAMVVVDGVVLGLTSNSTIDDSAAARLLDDIDAADILSLEVVKSQAAMERYGQRGHSGAVIITTNGKRRQAAPAPSSAPAWSVEAVIGHGRHNDRAGPVYYNSDGSPALRYAASVTMLRRARLSLYTKAEYVPDINGDHLDFCGIAPNGTCTQYFDDEVGVGIGLGIRAALSTNYAVGVLAGFGKYGERNRHFVESDVTLKLATHVGFVAGARYMRWTRNGYTHWFAPITAGLQLF